MTEEERKHKEREDAFNRVFDEPLSPRKPILRVFGIDKNPFVLAQLAKARLRELGRYQEADEVGSRCFKAKNYNDALSIVREYLDIQ
jgi:hypothetical protein